MAFSSLNTIASSCGLGVASAPNTTPTTYSSGLYYKGYYGNAKGSYFFGVDNPNAYYNNGIIAFSDSNTSKTLLAQGTTTQITTTNIDTFTNSIAGYYMDNIMVTFYGYFKPTTSGTYYFRLGTSSYANDDIAILWIGSAGETISSLKSRATAPSSSLSYTASPSYTDNNAKLIVSFNLANNSSTNVGSKATVSVTLTKDLYYPILMNWGQSTGGEYCELAIAPPTASTTFSTDGSSYYFNTGA